VTVAVAVVVLAVDFELLSELETKKTLGVLPSTFSAFQKTLTVDETTFGAKLIRYPVSLKFQQRGDSSQSWRMRYRLHGQML
jgi:hypothetical protein